MTDRQITAQRILNRIAEFDGDLNAAFPNPFRFHKKQHGRRQAFLDRELAHHLCERDPSRPWGYEANGAYFVRPCLKALEAFLQNQN